MSCDLGHKGKSGIRGRTGRTSGVAGKFQGKTDRVRGRYIGANETCKGECAIDRRPERSSRLGSLALAVGTLLFGGVSLFHPPTVNPWVANTPLAEAAHPGWVVDHWVLLVAVTLMHLGLLTLHTRLSASETALRSSVACALAVGSLALWLAVFLFEVTGWPIVAKAVAQGAQGVAAGAALEVVARALWATGLSVGYAAGFLLGLAIALWSADFEVAFQGSCWFARLGIIGGVYTAVVQPLSLAAPSVALWLLIPAAALLGAWLLWTAWLAWTSGR